MLKFFRKYNKIILVIGGSFLMVSFLLMDSIGRLAGQLGLQADYAVVDGRTIERGELRESLDALNIVQRMAPEVLAAIGISAEQTTDHWFLLTYEAEKAGLVGGPGDGGAEFIETAANLVADRQIQQFAQQLRGLPDAERILANQHQSIYDQYTQRLAANRQRLIQQGQPEIIIDRALSKMRAVIRLLRAQPSFNTVSRPRALNYATELFDIAFAKIGVIPPSASDADIPAPTDEEIRGHFQTYKSQRPADNELGIGYLLEPAVRIESIGIERQPIVDSLTVDDIEVNRFWRTNKDRFGESWTDAKQRATNAYKEDLAARILDRAVRIVQRETLRTTRNIPTDGAYKRLPDDWESRRIALNELAGILEQELSEEFDFDMPEPVVRPLSNEWLDRGALASLSGLGGSNWRLNETTNIPFADMMLNARVLDGNPEFGVQRGLLVGPFRASDGAYFARIDDVRAEGEPESIDEDLRARIVADIRAIKVYEDLKSNAEDFRLWLSEGFEEAFAEIAPDRTLQDVEISRSSVATPGQTRVLQRFDDEVLRDAVMDRVQSWDPLMQLQGKIALYDRVFVVPMPEERSLAAVMVYGRNPLTHEEYREGSPLIRTVAMERRAEARQALPYSLRSLIDRHDVRFFALSGEERDLFEESGTSPEDAPQPGSAGS